MNLQHQTARRLCTAAAVVQRNNPGLPTEIITLLAIKLAPVDLDIAEILRHDNRILRSEAF